MTAIDRGRLAKLLGMLGSSHDGECLAAARAAERMRRDADATWTDIVMRATLPAQNAADIDIDEAISRLLRAIFRIEPLGTRVPAVHQSSPPRAEPEIKGRAEPAL